MFLRSEDDRVPDDGCLPDGGGGLFWSRQSCAMSIAMADRASGGETRRSKPASTFKVMVSFGLLDRCRSLNHLSIRKQSRVRQMNLRCTRGCFGRTDLKASRPRAFSCMITAHHARRSSRNALFWISAAKRLEIRSVGTIEASYAVGGHTV